jgi:hypothetical protein
MAEMINPYKEAIGQFLKKSIGLSSEPISIQCCSKDKKCHFVMLGSLITSLTHSGLWPLSKCDTSQQSVHQLLLKLSTLSLENLAGIILDPKPINITNSQIKAPGTNDSTRSMSSILSSTRFGTTASLFKLHGAGSATRVTYRPGVKDGHSGCHPVPQERTSIEKAIASISVELDEVHLDYLQKQAAKTGISTGHQTSI